MFQRSGVLCFASATAKFKKFSWEGEDPCYMTGKMSSEKQFSIIWSMYPISFITLVMGHDLLLKVY